MDKNTILIYAEVTREGKIAQVSLELAYKAQELKQSLENAEVKAFIISQRQDFGEVIEALSNVGVDEVIIVTDEIFKDYDTEIYLEAAVKLIKEIQPKIVLIGATTQGRDLAPRISSTIQTGLTADCTGLEINEKGDLAATRPTFGGNLMATILCKTLPQMATVRPNVFRVPKNTVKKDTKVTYKWIDVHNIEKKTELVNFIKNTQNDNQNLTEAQIILAGGKGMKSKEGFKLLEDVASEIGASVGASRAAVEAGWVSPSVQIGQTGKTVSPKLYIACGISGAIQHLMGINSSDKILAINTDPKAPIFNSCDYGIVGDAIEILPELATILKQNKS